jgi:uncharacterized protein YdaU (DUF1376 family)
MPSDLPYMEFYPRDYLSSSTVRDMPLVARAIYVELLMHQWEDECLPNNPARLMQRVNATKEEWALFEEFFDEKFPVCEDGMRRNRRVDADRKETARKIEANKVAGAMGAKKRWHGKAKDELGSNDSDPITPPNSPAIATPSKPQCDSIAITDTDTDTELISPPPREKFQNLVSDLMRVYPRGDREWDPMIVEPALAHALEYDKDRHDEILAGAERYRAYCEADETIGTTYVKRIHNFLRDREWLKPWNPPVKRLRRSSGKPSIMEVINGAMQDCMGEAS